MPGALVTDRTRKATTEALLASLGPSAEAIRDTRTLLNRLYAEQTEVFAELRNRNVNHDIIAKAAGVTVPAVIQRLRSAKKS